jgi:hypothetical protein
MISSRKRNFATHRTPNPAIEAADTTSVEVVMASAMATKAVDSSRPAMVKPQNGRTWRWKLVRSRRFHTQRLLSTNAGTLATVAAMTFAVMPASSRKAWPKISTTWCTATDTTETIE